MTHATAPSETKPHVLLVEDDPAIATSLKVTFKREGWQVTWLDNATAVLPNLQDIYQSQQGLAGIILDVGLPDGDGLSLCQSIRHSQDIGTLKQLPIVFLTARNDEVDRILGLEMGGDDYCTKPFSPRELVARLKAIWRREKLTTPTQSPVIQPTTTQGAHLTAVSGDAIQTFAVQSGTWRYEPLTYTLYWNNHKIDLSNTERKLLLALLANPERVFSRELLLSAISDHPDHRLARTVDSHIKSIRKQLAAIDSSIEVIYTHRGLGYGLYPA